MPKAFTSGENTADVRGEKQINKTGIMVFAAALIFFVLLFVIWTGLFGSLNNPPGGPANSIENSGRAQP